LYSQFTLDNGQCWYDSKINPGMVNEWGIVHRYKQLNVDTNYCLQLNVT